MGLSMALIDNLVARRVRLHRERRQWTVDELSFRSGLPSAAILQLENGAAANHDDLLLVALALEIPPREICSDGIGHDYSDMIHGVAQAVKQLL